MSDQTISQLSIVNLSKHYGKKKVVKEVSLTMSSNEIIGLLGPNGAGKTTIFYMIVGFIKVNGGSILLDGNDITSHPMHRRARKGISYLPQEPSIFRKLSVRDNIALVADTRDDLTKIEKKKLVDRLLEEFGIAPVQNQMGYTLSGGERRRTEIARALANNPRFLLLDEPFAGIDPKAVYEIKILISSLASRGIGILITDHNVRDTLAITTKGYIIHQGELLASGSRQDLLANREAIRLYFGEDFSNGDER
ncbi:MAG: LPS export ABC transporter ATP-binding protein [Sphaerochaetaceae bacterium]|nr:LPS export ABC transporter ATP-binding protein [Sphaerochaetaceae bacterium]MDC7247650.1 LPS export ABC transporter ATP-binding protein [Sphaerochaetaceae bacterium]